MNDLISRQEAIAEIEFGITYAEALNKETGEVTELFKQSNDELRKAIERIKRLPSVKPMYTWKCRCSKCGYERSMMSTQGRYPRFCENCGADMRESE